LAKTSIPGLKSPDRIPESNEISLRRFKTKIGWMNKRGKKSSKKNKEENEKAQNLHPASFTTSEREIVPEQSSEHVISLKSYNPHLV
ncbi:hypothetical protein LCGC14_2030480, partial [marine sediment metagenome]